MPPTATRRLSATSGTRWCDTYPNTAWNGPGGENSDECAWIRPGRTGGVADVSFGSFGSYAEQASWSNDTNGCAISHQILDHGGSQGNTVTVTSPGNQSGTVGTAASLRIHASDSASDQTLTCSATGLPAGLSVDSSTGLISGTPTTAGAPNVTVTAEDTTGATGSTSFTWTVSAAGGGGTVTVTNPGPRIWIHGFPFRNLHREGHRDRQRRLHRYHQLHLHHLLILILILITGSGLHP